MITGKMYVELCKLVYQPTVPVQRILWEHAVMMVDNAARLGLRPHDAPVYEGRGGRPNYYCLPVKKLRHPRELVETYRLAVEE